VKTTKEASEHVEQRCFVEWVRLKHGVRIFAIPNGGKRNPREAMRLVVEGVSSGVPDLFVPEWLLWVEMKTKVGIVSKQQKDWIDYLNGIPGHTAIVARGFEDGMAQVGEFLKGRK
jgi:hypothetical protein